MLLIDLLNKGFITIYFSFVAKSFYCVLIYFQSYLQKTLRATLLVSHRYFICSLRGFWQVSTQARVFSVPWPYLHSPSNDDGVHVARCPHVASFTAV